MAEPEPELEVEASLPVVSLEVEEKEENSHGMITQALLVGDMESAVDLCIKDRLFPHALTLAAHAGPELFAKVCKLMILCMVKFAWFRRGVENGI